MKVQFVHYVEDRVSPIFEAKEVQLSYGKVLLDSREFATFQGDMWLYDNSLWTDVIIFGGESDAEEDN